MFGKKILSVVGLIFLGSQIVSIEGQVCAPTYNSRGDPACSAVNCGQNDNGETFIATGIDESAGNEYAVTVTYTDGVGVSCALNDAFNGDDYCVDENKKIAARSDNWCSSTSNQCTYYDCEDGDCIVHGTTRDSCNPKGSPSEQGKCIENGYYLMDNTTEDIKTTAGDSGYLYLCEKFGTANIICKKVGTGSGETGEAVPTGFLVNSGAGSDTGKYIKCNGGRCTAIGLVIEYGAAVPIDNCQNAEVNDIILVDGTDMYICLENSIDGGLKIDNNDNNRQFFVDVKDSETIFGTTTNNDFKYLLVDLNGGNAILHAKDNARYKYADASLEIFGRKSGNICDNGSLKGSASEFKKLEDEDVTDDTSDLNVDYYKKL